MLIHGDCMAEMARIAPASIDLILCDLPYEVSACKWDTQLPLAQLLENYWRLCKPRAAVVLTAKQPFSSALITSSPKEFKYAWVWLKSHPSGFQYAKYRPMQKHEDILVFGRQKLVYNPQMTKGLRKACRSGSPETPRDADTVVGRGVKANLSIVYTDTYFPTTQLYFPSGARCKSLHPTQKPVELMEYLIRTYTNEGDTVLDNCMGSGTTGVACRNTNRKFIGIELDPAYFSLAENRIRI